VLRVSFQYICTYTRVRANAQPMLARVTAAVIVMALVANVTRATEKPLVCLFVCLFVCLCARRAPAWAGPVVDDERADRSRVRRRDALAQALGRGAIGRREAQQDLRCGPAGSRCDAHSLTAARELWTAAQTAAMDCAAACARDGHAQHARCTTRTAARVHEAQAAARPIRCCRTGKRRHADSIRRGLSAHPSRARTVACSML
jgi:hypothetical protein